MELDEIELKRLKELVPYKVLAPTPNEIINEIERLNNIIDELEKWLKSNEEHFAEAIPFRETLRKLQELKKGNNVQDND